MIERSEDTVDSKTSNKVVSGFHGRFFVAGTAGRNMARTAYWLYYEKVTLNRFFQRSLLILKPR